MSPMPMAMRMRRMYPARRSGGSARGLRVRVVAGLVRGAPRLLLALEVREPLVCERLGGRMGAGCLERRARGVPALLVHVGDAEEEMRARRILEPALPERGLERAASGAPLAAREQHPAELEKAVSGPPEPRGTLERL